MQQALDRQQCFSLIEVMLPTGSRTRRLSDFAMGFKAANESSKAVAKA
jgi:hypothetical protein